MMIENSFNQNIVRQMIDYATKENKGQNNGKEEEIKKTFKYPFNSCELLCSDSSYITDVIFQETIIHSDGLEQAINEEEQIITNDDDEDEDDDSNGSPLQRKLSGVSKYKMLEYFFSFLDSRYVMNDVLSGYFSKIFNKLVKCQGLFIINFLFNDAKTSLTKLISHIEHDSICQCIYNLLVYNCKSETIKNKKVQLFQMIINQLIIDLKKNIAAICDMLSNAFCNEQFILFFFEHIDLLNSFCPIIISDNYNKEGCLLKLIVQIIEVISKYHSTKSLPAEIAANDLQVINSYEYDPNALLPIDKGGPSALAQAIRENIKMQISTILDIVSQLCLLYLPEKQNPLIIDSNTNTIINAFDIIQVRLGNEKLLLIALMRSLVILFNQSNVFNKTIKKTLNALCERKIMELLINIFFNFELCNSFQHYFLDIIKVVLSNVIFEPLAHELLEEGQGNLISKLLSFIASKHKLTYISGHKTTSCLFSSVIVILDAIYMSDNRIVSAYTEGNKELSLVHSEIVGKVIDIYNGFLLYDNVNEVITNDENEPQEEVRQTKIAKSRHPIQVTIELGLRKLKDFRASKSNTATPPMNHFTSERSVCSPDLDTAMICDSHNDSIDDIVQIQHNIPNQSLFKCNHNNSKTNNEFDDNVYWKPAIALPSTAEETELLNELLL